MHSHSFTCITPIALYEFLGILARLTDSDQDDLNSQNIEMIR